MSLQWIRKHSPSITMMLAQQICKVLKSEIPAQMLRACRQVSNNSNLRFFVKFFPTLPVLSYFRFSLKKGFCIFLTSSSASKQTQAKTFVEFLLVFCGRESFVSQLLISSKAKFSVFRPSFKFYSGRMKTNTQRYPMFAILAPSPTQCVAFWMSLCCWWFSWAWGEGLALQESCFGGRLSAKHLSQENKPFSKSLYFTG